jgi:hypothetical protein
MDVVPVEIVVKDSTSGARRRRRGRPDPQGQDRPHAGVLGRGGEPGVGFDHTYHFFWASRTSSVTQPFSRKTVVQRLLTLIPNDEIARNSYFELHFVACAGHE